MSTPSHSPPQLRGATAAAARDDDVIDLCSDSEPETERMPTAQQHSNVAHSSKSSVAQQGGRGAGLNPPQQKTTTPRSSSLRGVRVDVGSSGGGQQHRGVEEEGDDDFQTAMMPQRAPGHGQKGKAPARSSAVRDSWAPPGERYAVFVTEPGVVCEKVRQPSQLYPTEL